MATSQQHGTSQDNHHDKYLVHLVVHIRLLCKTEAGKFPPNPIRKPVDRLGDEAHRVIFLSVKWSSGTDFSSRSFRRWIWPPFCLSGDVAVLGCRFCLGECEFSRVRRPREGCIHSLEELITQHSQFMFLNNNELKLTEDLKSI